MSLQRIIVIGVILVGASLGWALLGATTDKRTRASELRLGQDVERLFGPEIVQTPPWVEAAAVQEGPVSTDITVEFEHENRYRGLIWFSVYTVRFEAEYTFLVPAPGKARPVFRMDLPADSSIDALEVTIDDRPAPVDSIQIRVPIETAAGEVCRVRVAYGTRGQDAWCYAPKTEKGGLRAFRLRALTNFDAIDYPLTGLSPTAKAAKRSDGKPGLEAAWEYSQMLPAKSRVIGVVMPSRPSAGYLSARLSLFAPVSLFFFFLVLVLIQAIKGWKLHPVNYLFLAAAFFAFHILLAYLVDHLPIHIAFWISALVSVFLVVSYLRLALGNRSAILTVGVAQLVYLVFFSYAFFWEGWTGLTIVIGAIVTLFVIMQLTGRIDWDQLGRAEAEAPAEA